MDTPIVTILVPTCNNAETLGRCLQSAIDQDYGNLQLAVMDNHSSDDTYDLILAFEKRYRERVYTGRTCTRVSENELRQRGYLITSPRTQYLHFLQPDHTLAPSFISRAVACFESDENIGCVLAQADVLHPDGTTTATAPLFPQDCVLPGDAMMEFFMTLGLDLPVAGVYRKEVLLLAKREGLIFNRFPEWLPLVMASSSSAFGYLHDPLAHHGDAKAIQGTNYIPSLEACFEHYLFLQSFCTIAARLQREAIGRQFPAALRRLSLDCVRSAQVLGARGEAQGGRSYLSLAQAFLPEIAETQACREAAAILHGCPAE